MKQYKARVENPSLHWHTMIIYLQAENIGDAIQDVKDTLSPLGIDNTHITQLVEETTHGH